MTADYKRRLCNAIQDYGVNEFFSNELDSQAKLFSTTNTKNKFLGVLCAFKAVYLKES